MKGLNANTGKALSGLDHLRQSIIDILTTPVGTRVMRRDYGSELYKLIDAPVNHSTLLRMYAATATALRKWETRFKLESVKAINAEPGKVILDLTGIYLPDGKEITLEGVEVS